MRKLLVAASLAFCGSVFAAGTVDELPQYEVGSETLELLQFSDQQNYCVGVLDGISTFAIARGELSSALTLSSVSELIVEHLYYTKGVWSEFIALQGSHDIATVIAFDDVEEIDSITEVCDIVFDETALEIEISNTPVVEGGVI